MFFPCETSYAFTAPVAHYQPNPFGLSDMYGNVREYVADCWNPSYWGQDLGTAARVTGSCETAVLRGGGWHDAPTNIRPARRFREDRERRRADQGFRVVAFDQLDCGASDRPETAAAARPISTMRSESSGRKTAEISSST